MRLAFVQGGVGGFRLVYVTTPIAVRSLGNICETVWSPAEMPLTYATAPVVVDNHGRSDVPLLAEMARGVRRSTAVGKFASAFRSRRLPVAGEIGKQVLFIYVQFRRNGAEIATGYEEAMPYPPPRIERNRASRFKWVRSRRRAAARPGSKKGCAHKS
jgi:hypothetical protein